MTSTTVLYVALTTHSAKVRQNRAFMAAAALVSGKRGRSHTRQLHILAAPKKGEGYKMCAEGPTDEIYAVVSVFRGAMVDRMWTST